MRDGGKPTSLWASGTASRPAVLMTMDALRRREGGEKEGEWGEERKSGPPGWQGDGEEG